MKAMPKSTFIILCGVPGAGKSFARESIITTMTDCRVISTDDYIEKVAADLGKTYSEVFADTIDAAQGAMNVMLTFAIGERLNIIHDQTNLTPKKRKSLLSRVPSKDYSRIAIYCEIDEDSQKSRLERRVGKFIPPSVLSDMQRNYVRPTLDEGFDAVINSSSP